MVGNSGAYTGTSGKLPMQLQLTYNSIAAVTTAIEQVHAYRHTHCISEHEKAYPKIYTYLP